MTTIIAHVPVSKLVRSISAALPCASTDDTRPHLAGLHVEGTDTGLRLVSTDGHRLARVDVATAANKDYPRPALVPAILWTRDHAERVLRECKAFARTRRGLDVTLTLQSDGSVMNGKDAVTPSSAGCLAAETFPPYAKVIPTGEVDASVGLCARYTADASKAFDALVPGSKSTGMSVDVRGSLDPVVFRGDDNEGSTLTVVVMPMRVDGPNAPQDKARKGKADASEPESKRVAKLVAQLDAMRAERDAARDAKSAAEARAKDPADEAARLRMDIGQLQCDLNDARRQRDDARAEQRKAAEQLAAARTIRDAAIANLDSADALISALRAEIDQLCASLA